MTRPSKRKISLRRGKQYTSPVTLGGGGEGINIMIRLEFFNTFKLTFNGKFTQYIYIYIIILYI